jgi:hypothetical protein
MMNEEAEEDVHQETFDGCARQPELIRRPRTPRYQIEGKLRSNKKIPENLFGLRYGRNVLLR